MIDGYYIRISDCFSIGIAEGELDRNKDGKEDGIKDDEDEGNVVSNVNGIKDGIFEG